MLGALILHGEVSHDVRCFRPRTRFDGMCTLLTSMISLLLQFPDFYNLLTWWHNIISLPAAGIGGYYIIAMENLLEGHRGSQLLPLHRHTWTKRVILSTTKQIKSKG